MARTNNLTNFLTDVAGAIKEKKGSQTAIPAANFDTEIRNLPSQGTYQQKSITISSNTTTTITPDQNYDAIDELTVVTQVPTGDVKLFDTVAHMQQDPDAEEDDLAIVYREELSSVTSESEFDSCIFPSTVILEESFTGSTYANFRSIGSGWFDGTAEMSSSYFRFNGYGDGDDIRVTYTSSDGITYTRTDSGATLQEFGTTIKYENYGGTFPEVIGNFMKIGGNYLEGLYQYKTYIDADYLNYIPISALSKQTVNTSTYYVWNGNVMQNEEICVSKLGQILNKMVTDSILPNTYIVSVFLNSNNDICCFVTNGAYSYNNALVLNSNLEPLGLTSDSNNNSQGTVDVYKLNLNTLVYTKIATAAQVTVSGTSNYYRAYTDIVTVPIKYTNGTSANTTIFIVNNNNMTRQYLKNDDSSHSDIKKSQYQPIRTNYIPANTQFTATPEIVYNEAFLGKNGAGEGTLFKNVTNSFISTDAKVMTEMYKAYENVTPLVITDNNKSTVKRNIHRTY